MKSKLWLAKCSNCGTTKKVKVSPSFPFFCCVKCEDQYADFCFSEKRNTNRVSTNKKKVIQQKNKQKGNTKLNKVKIKREKITLKVKGKKRV